ncbi:MAG: aminotransferase class I/II-fold pyridoxal phosphate-dependent enzyme [Woeseiaceae bacterium]|nr:aminotransferase class I/II-fold pyridoxal phosphate-dependent enzyme [Woeseiaceae bacterium]NIP20397.1 aminotransferase class I/II-fold pyridoxal phosphate-dependent enzyme [Woeseiaceae bacterium]NIS89286.1 aminotransferase class I/II-fold pyridoxal phosphate-dependent enzyme [Woeseiaceae bacterium]
MLSIDKQDDTYLYRQVIDLIGENIDTGTLRPGDRLPSLRKMSQSAGVSIPTVRQAYIELERQRRIESRPQSGFYVRHRAINPIVSPAPSSDGQPVCLNCRPLMERVYEGINNPNLVPLGIANPCMAKPAAKNLHRSMKRIMSRAEERSLGYASTLGEPSLRRQIAYHYLDTAGVQAQPDHIAITNGGQEALLIALSAVASTGDVIAVETPTYHGMLELIDGLGMLAVEVETCPEEGVVLDELRRTLEAYPVKACMFSTTLSNPLGVTMPERDRRRLVQILEEFDTVLIEDDVYGDLRFDGYRPIPAQFLGDHARIITCGSFSKTAAPGYRVGWAYSPHFIEDIRRLKRAFSCSSGFLQQLTLADFLASGDYARHLKMLRPELQRNAERMAALIGEHFPSETRTSKPVGGSVLWLELPENVNAEELFDDAIAAGISVAPGQIFSPANRYDNFVRLSFGHPWSDKTDDAVRWLGRRVSELAKA